MKHSGISFIVALSMLLLISGQALAEAQNFDTILQNVKDSGHELSPVTKKWMKKWRDLDLEDTNQYIFPEISGTTSVNLKIGKIDLNDTNGYKSFGSFVTVNEAANPNAEIAYFNLAVILKADHFFRPVMRYELGDRAKQEFKKILENAVLKGKMRNENKERILKAINNEGNLLGCLKAKKEEFTTELEDMVGTSWLNRDKILKTHTVLKFLQAKNKQPSPLEKIALLAGYTGNALDLAREFSIILTLDVVFGQYDRFSGGNVVIMKDEKGLAHFYATDNGGSDVVNSVRHAQVTTEIFNRFDRKVILKLKELYQFLNDPSVGFLGYTNAETFVVDLGLYFNNSPAKYVAALKTNLAVLLQHVHESEEKYGNEIYFVE